MSVAPANAPFLLRRLRELRLVDGIQEQGLAREGIVTLADLDLAIAEQRPVAADPALRRTAQALRREVRPILLGRAWDIVERFMSALAQCSAIEALEASGEMRR